MHSGLYHSAVSNCQVDHNRCLLRYSLDLWSLDSLHIHNRALFDWHQTPNLDSNDGKFHCDSPLVYDFEQCTVAMLPSVLSANLSEGTLMANHLLSSQQFLVYHLHSKGIHNKIHRQRFLHVIGQGCWMSLWQSITSSCPIGLLIKFEMQFHTTDLSTSGCNSSLNIAMRGSVKQQ